MGDPKLMWSFNREGECDEALKQDRDTAMGIYCGREAPRSASATCSSTPARSAVSRR